MTANLDTLRTALNVLTDDHVVPQFRRRPGHPKKLSGAELVWLAVAQVLLSARSDRHWLRLCHSEVAGYPFPCLSHQPGYHKRLKAAPPLLCQIMLNLATVCPWWADGLRLLDATPGAVRHFPADRRPSGLAGWTNYG